MNILLTFDYELFFGAQTGTVQHCMVEPTSMLLDIFSRHGCRATFFVDAGCVVSLGEAAKVSTQAKADYGALCLQLEEIATAGHDIQLHIHPHWEDAVFENDSWKISTERFRLHDFGVKEQFDICRKYAAALKLFAKNKVNAFRAGGWCLQPFEEIAEALKSVGICADSTVFHGGFNISATHFYDYRKAPNKSFYRFESDPLEEDVRGSFVELPIADILVSPLFYWNFALHKFLAGKKHQAFGDGQSIPNSRKQILRLLTRFSHSVVSCDGFKSSLLRKAFKAQQSKFGEDGDFVVIGHPKAATPYSLEQLEKFIAENGEHKFIAFSEHSAVKND